MELCAIGHEEVAYEGVVCPVCELIGDFLISGNAKDHRINELEEKLYEKEKELCQPQH